VAVGSEFFESGDHVIALGTYTGRAKATGRDFTARFAHVWTLAKWQNRPAAAVRRYRSNCTCIGRVDSPGEGERTRPNQRRT
jgi:hypothetical protein